MTASRWAAWATPGAFVFLAGAMIGLELIPFARGLGIMLAVVAAFGPSGWLVPCGWRRRMAEALLLPVAVVMTIVPSDVIRQMMIAPIFVLAAWSAWSATARRFSGRTEFVVATAFFGLAVRLVVGWSPVSEGFVGVGGAIAASMAVPAALGAISPPLALVGVILAVSLPLQSLPAFGWILAVTIPVFAWWLNSSSWFDRDSNGSRGPVGLYPGLGAAVLVAVSVGAWGLLGLRDLLPGFNLIGGMIVVGVLAASWRVVPATAGACMVLACLSLDHHWIQFRRVVD